MTMNWLDLTIGGILALSFLTALRNGMTREVVRIVALIFGIVAAMWGYERVAAEYLAPHIADPQWARFAAFGAIVLACLTAGGLVAALLAKLWGLAGLRWVDRLLGGAFGLVRGAVVATALVLAVVAFAPIAGAEATVAESQLAPLVLHSARAASWVAPTSLQSAYSEGFERVREAWIEGKTKLLDQSKTKLVDQGKPSPGKTP
jgi:membrane protein required for colicin V production